MKEFDFREKFIEMFPKNYIKKLPDDATWCEHCNGIGWHNKKEGFISLCYYCNGKGYIKSEYCKCGNKLDRYGSDKCRECDRKEFNEKQKIKNLERYNNATKIKYKDYKGRFLVDDKVIESDNFEEWLYDQIVEEGTCPTWVWGARKELALNLDIVEAVTDACENGYEDMFDNLDTNSLKPIQEQIDNWIKEQGDYAYNYYEDYSIVVELDELIEDILKQISAESQ
jgi:hypothetical protein